ncbi:MAG: hypothetical protein ACYCZF_00465 [Anaerolineae bacterium]
MHGQPKLLGYRDRSRVLRVAGVMMLLLGAGFGFLAPLEMYCFYLFSPGGRFAYAGFGFGSFMFGNIASQIVGYYMLCAVLLVLGYGHFRLRRWCRVAALTALRCWQVLGAPLAALTFIILLASKEIGWPAAMMAALLLAFSYLGLPTLLLRFYRGQNLGRTLEAADPTPSRLDAKPIPILVLCALSAFYIVVLHLLIFFNGIYPLPWGLRFGLPGIILLVLSSTWLALLTWGTWRQMRWAWWGGALWWGWFTAAVVVSLARTSWLQLLVGLNLPPYEIGFLDGIPAQGWHLALFFGVPLAATWGVMLAARKHLRRGGG